MTTTADIFDAAADLIEAEGWGQGNEVSVCEGNGPYCFMTALRTVGGSALPLTPVFRDTEIFPAYVNSTFALVDWNDHPDRTQDEVTAALRSCAEAARTQETTTA